MGHARACTPIVRMLLLARDAAVDWQHPGEKESSRAWCSFMLAAMPMDTPLCSMPVVTPAWLPTRKWGSLHLRGPSLSTPTGRTC
jgi:hypothetical protein